MANNQRNELTQEVAEQIGGALQRLKEIGSSTIIAPQHEAEQKGLIQFLSRVLLEHADEMLACWMAVKVEYEPLVLGIAGVLSRSNGILMRRMQATQAQQKPVEQTENTQAAPDNVVQLPQQ